MMNLNGKHNAEKIKSAYDFMEDAKQYGSVLGLGNIKNLMGHLGNVQEQLQMIHVAGTNGKGSVCAVTAQILSAAGYRTGVYSSPAVFDHAEIYKIDGDQVPQEIFLESLAKVQAACAKMQEEGLPHPTVFEIETAAAFCLFLQEHCDYVVLETGLGGVLDATNIITRPVCSVITSISRDHMGFLGETLGQIAAAKAGIIKKGCPCVTAPQPPEVFSVIQKKAEEMGSELWTADADMIGSYEYDGQESRFTLDSVPCRVHCGLTGAFQQENLACALTAVRVLRKQGVCITDEAVCKGLAQVRMPGRFERICSKPEFYIDGAHNEGAALYLAETVKNCFADRRIVYIIGVLADKEYDKVLEQMLPYAAQVYTVTPENPRALDGRKLAQCVSAMDSSMPVLYVGQIKDAVKLAAAAAGEKGAVLAFGSFFYLRALKQAVKETLGSEPLSNYRVVSNMCWESSW